jgi:hypothetical protein
MTITVKKETLEKIQDTFKGKVELMEDTLFYIEMGDRIGDWDYFNALGYCIALAKGKDVSMYRLT